MNNTENLFQLFSQVFIESQQAFSKCDVELRSKCRTLAETLNKLAGDLEADPFQANLAVVNLIEDEVNKISKAASELDSRREFIKESVNSLQKSTKAMIGKS